MGKRGYTTVTLPTTRKKHIRLYTSTKIANAAKDVLDAIESSSKPIYYGVKLGQIIDAILERGRIEGRAEIIAEQDDIKARVKYRLPGRPRRPQRN